MRIIGGNDMSKVILVTGGSRSGKSVLAEQKALEHGQRSVLYLATAIPVDEDMKERIRIHQARRDAEWGTYEGYRDLGEIVRTTEKNTVLLDCVTVMITNILFENEINFDEVDNREIEDLEAQIMMELSDVIKGARDGNKTLILVTNEVGLSIVPSYRLGRIFSDIAGKANQFIASLSDEVYISISGVPLRLK
jgi:adenosylcobinamide kinase/adenosylcobinamide-phosphate guanylyltransferase